MPCTTVSTLSEALNAAQHYAHQFHPIVYAQLSMNLALTCIRIDRKYSH